MESSSRFPPLRTLDPWSSPTRSGDKDQRLTCLLTPLPRGKGLSLALARLLSDEIPDVRFTLDPRERADAVWVCGYGERAAPFLTRLRGLHPSAMIVVTGRAPAGCWGRAVIDAGADFACSWPVDYCLLGSILHRTHVGEEVVSNGVFDLDRAGA